MGKGWLEGQAKNYQRRMERRRAEQKCQTLFSNIPFEKGLTVSAALCGSAGKGDVLWADRSEQGVVQLINSNTPVAFLEGTAADQISRMMLEHGACMALVTEVLADRVAIINVMTYEELSAAE